MSYFSPDIRERIFSHINIQNMYVNILIKKKIHIIYFKWNLFINSVVIHVIKFYLLSINDFLVLIL